MKEPIASVWLGFHPSSGEILLSFIPIVDGQFSEELSARVCDRLIQDWIGEEVVIIASREDMHVGLVGEAAIRFRGAPKGSIPGRHAHLWRDYFDLLRGAVRSLSEVDRFLRSDELRKKIEMAIAISALESGRLIDVLKYEPARLGVYLSKEEIKLEPGNLLLDIDVSRFYPYSGYASMKIAQRAWLIATSANGIALARRVHENRELLIEGRPPGGIILTGLQAIIASSASK